MSWAASRIAPPVLTALRLTPVPDPNGVASVSPSMILTVSLGTPSSRATRLPNTLSWSCPVDCALTAAVTLPRGSTVIVAESKAGNP